MLMEKLIAIDYACSPHRKEQEREEQEKNLDEFTKLKRTINAQIHVIRQDLKERDRLLKENNRQELPSVKSSEIRQKIRDVTQRAEDLDKMYKSEHKKLKLKEKIPGMKDSEEKKKR